MVHLILTEQPISCCQVLCFLEKTDRTLASSWRAGYWAGCLVWAPVTYQRVTPCVCSCQSSRDSSVSLSIASLPSIRLFHTLKQLSKHHHLVECWCLKMAYFKQILKGELWCQVKQLVCCGSKFGSCYTGCGNKSKQWPSTHIELPAC